MLALILSSFVAGNRIGGGAQQLALAALGIEAFLAPTVALGRNPAKGATGRAIAPDHFVGMLADLEAEGLFARADLVITGYFASADQVRAAAGAVDSIRAATPGVQVIVDPIMGDHPKGLYVGADTAEAVVAELASRADVLAPNAWELERLTGETVGSAESALKAARSLGRPVLVTSVPVGPDEIGAVAVGEDARLFVHPLRARAPNGAGDLVTAVLAAGRGQGLSFQAAAERAVRAAALAIEAAGADGDLPLVGLEARLMQAPPAFRIETLA